MRQDSEKKTVEETMSDTVFLKDEIYLLYKEKVSAYVRNRISDTYAAEDIVSEVFMKVYQKLECYDESRASLSTWIYIITKNTVIDYYKKRKTQLAFLMKLRKQRVRRTKRRRMRSFWRILRTHLKNSAKENGILSFCTITKAIH